jgi:hypothetical protein
MKTAIEDLQLKQLWVVYPGKTPYRLTEEVQAIPLADIGAIWNYG